jgi:hypothetical protein
VASPHCNTRRLGPDSRDTYNVGSTDRQNVRMVVIVEFAATRIALLTALTMR